MSVQRGMTCIDTTQKQVGSRESRGSAHEQVKQRPVETDWKVERLRMLMLLMLPVSYKFCDFVCCPPK